MYLWRDGYANSIKHSGEMDMQIASNIVRDGYANSIKHSGEMDMQIAPNIVGDTPP